jgi:hypothetical protein
LSFHISESNADRLLEKAKADAKTKKAEEKKHAKEEKQRAKEISAAVVSKKSEFDKEKSATAAGAVIGTDSAPAPKTVDPPKTVEDVPFATSPRESKVKSWFKEKLQSRRLSKSQKTESTDSPGPTMAGGITTVIPGNASQASLEHEHGSEREVALAGKLGDGEPDPHEELAHHERSISPYIAVSPAPKGDADRGRPELSRHASSRGEGGAEEAKDTVDDDLTPPPKVGASTGRDSPSPIRDSKFHEAL